MRRYEQISMLHDEQKAEEARPASLRGYDAKLVSLETSKNTGVLTRVQQQFADEVDVNTIVRRFGITRELPMWRAGGVYGDFTGIQDYDSAVEQIDRARAAFMKLDPVVREKFGNDPGNLIRMASELSEDEFLRKMGGEPPQAVPDAPPGAPAPSGGSGPVDPPAGS